MQSEIAASVHRILGFALLGPPVMVVIAYTWDGIDGVVGWWRRRRLPAIEPDARIADWLVPHPEPVASPRSYETKVPTLDGVLQPVLATLPLDELDETVVVWSPVWREEDGPLTDDLRTLAQSAGLLLAAGTHGGGSVWRRVAVPGNVRINELMPLMGQVGQNAYEWRKRFKARA